MKLRYILSLCFLTSTLLAKVPTYQQIQQLWTGPLYQPYVTQGYMFNAHANTQTPFKMVFSWSPSTIKVSVNTPITDSHVSMDTQFNVQSATMNIYNNELVTKLGYSQRTGKRNPFDEMVFQFYLNKKEQRSKGVYYDANTIDTFSIIPVLQQLCYVDTMTAMSVNLSVQHLAKRVPVLISKKITTDLNPYFSKYTVPQRIADLPKDIPYTIFALKVTRWQGFIYNHHHYYVFSGTKPYHYVGQFGGQNKQNLFYWVF
jgi:hypothetical protein